MGDVNRNLAVLGYYVMKMTGELFDESVIMDVRGIKGYISDESYPFLWKGFFLTRE